MIFSSSAIVYGQPEKVPCDEDSALNALNPYGRTKEKLFATPDIGCVAYNLRGTTVLEMVNTFEKAYGKKIPIHRRFMRPPRRPKGR